MKKRTRRKHWGLSNPITLAISGATITSEGYLDKVRLIELSAIEAFAKGQAGPREFRDLCDLLNVAETMGSKMGIGPEAVPACAAAQEALVQARERYDKTGSLALTAQGLTALRDLYEFHDLQRTSVDRSTYERAIEITANRIRSGHPAVQALARNPNPNQGESK